MSFLTLWQGFLTAITSFLLTDPMTDFLGIFVLLGIVGIFKEIIKVQ